MVQIGRFQRLLVWGICILSVVLCLPNFFSLSTIDQWPDFMPKKQVALGLDLQGGSHLLLEVDKDAIRTETYNNIKDDLKNEMRKAKIGYKDVISKQDRVDVGLRQDSEMPLFQKLIQSQYPDLEIKAGKPGHVSLVLNELALKNRIRSVTEQSIEVVRRRIDEVGTKEPIIQRQGDTRIVVQLPGVDDPKRMKDIIGKTAKMSFHLLVEPGLGSREIYDASDPSKKYSVGEEVLSGEHLTDARVTEVDRKPAVSFRFDPVGAKKFGFITQNNSGKFLAIILDDQVISAPRINEPILTGNGVIEGEFKVKEASDLAALLRAGALPAPLNVLEERSVGPSLGADSVASGKTASIIGSAFVMLFMLICYGTFGMMANLALLVNIALILGLLSWIGATLTLPGIAGIILTIGMAVDGNVLIFERIREEFKSGKSVLSSIDAGYRRAMATIVDSNLTTLIAAFLLFLLGTGPIKGFAVTLTIGIITSMFSSVMLTRTIMMAWYKRMKPKSLSI